MNEMITDLLSLIAWDPSRKYHITCESKAYGWHNPHFPPEYRRACLCGRNYEPDPHTDVYYMMACWYEKLSGKKAPCDFRVYSEWKKHIYLSDYFTGKRDKEDMEKMIRAIEIGTRRKPEERDLMEILELF